MSIFDLFKDDKSKQQISQLVDMLSDEVSHRVATGLQKEFVALAEVEQAEQRVIELQRQIALLTAEKETIQEGFSRKEREIEHKTGLLRQEIEAERKTGEKDFALRVQEAKLAAREAGLAEREKSFSEKMTFIEKRFTEEVGYLKTMVKELAERLPDARVFGSKEL